MAANVSPTWAVEGAPAPPRRQREIVQRDDADERVAIDHREATDLSPLHALSDRLGVVVGRDRLEVATHHLSGAGHFQGAALRVRGHAGVAISHDAHQPATLDHGDDSIAHYLATGDSDCFRYGTASRR